MPPKVKLTKDTSTANLGFEASTLPKDNPDIEKCLFVVDCNQITPSTLAA